MKQWITTLIVLFLLAASMARAEVLYRQDFDALPDFEGAGHPSGVTCGRSDFPGCDDPCPYQQSDGTVACFYIGGACSGDHCSISIDETAATGGGKAFHHWTDRRPGGVPGNDGLLGWFSGSYTISYPEIWLRVKIRFDPNYSWADTFAQKMLRVAYLRGNGDRGAIEGGNTFGDCAFHEVDCNGPSLLTGLKASGNSDMALTFGVRGFDSGSDSKSSYFKNAYDVRYCNGSSGPRCTAELDQACPGACDGDPVPDGSFGGGGFDYDDPGHLGDGQWHTWTLQVKVNDPIGTLNGELRAWMDGQLQYTRTDANFREAGTPDLVEGFNVVSLGGNTTNGWSGGAAEQYYAYDDLCITTSEADLDGCFGPGAAQCGDGVMNGDEPCDGDDLGGQSCAALGFDDTPGLACMADCSGFDTSACSSPLPAPEGVMRIDDRI